MTTATLTEARVPESSVIHGALPGAHFSDCYEIPDRQPDDPALQTWLDLVVRAPGWTNQLMALRNRAVRLVGLKDLGHIGDLGTGAARCDASNYRCGDRVGIFEIRHLSPHEVVLGQDDRHLNVQVSLYKHPHENQAVLTLTTVVHIHNAMGRLYMALVTPFHKLIVRSMLARAANLSPHSNDHLAPR